MSETAKAPVNPTPKQRFNQNPSQVSRHKDMVGLPSFDHSADAAMLEMVKNVVMASDGSPNSALAGFYRIQGAYEYLTHLKLLTVQVEMPKPVALPSLDHKI